MLPYYRVLVTVENERGKKTCKHIVENLTKTASEKEKLKLVENIDAYMRKEDDLERKLIIYRKKEVELRYFNKRTRELHCKYFIQVKRYTLLQLLNIKP
ncbi:hypothetical protein EOE59_14615 [Listeria monocytogenes]|nr:hypothetical protein [Listeria monocytogenes]KXX34217.1 hypothetical protein AWI79_14965 [Listeria monocytogenes]